MKITTATARALNGRLQTTRDAALEFSVDSSRGHLLKISLVDMAEFKRLAKRNGLNLKTVWKGGDKDTQEQRGLDLDLRRVATVATFELTAKQFEKLGLSLLRQTVWSKRS